MYDPVQIDANICHGIQKQIQPQAKRKNSHSHLSNKAFKQLLQLFENKTMLF